MHSIISIATKIAGGFCPEQQQNHHQEEQQYIHPLHLFTTSNELTVSEYKKLGGHSRKQRSPNTCPININLPN